MNPRPDIVLHIGLAAGRPFYTLERGAHGRGYGAIPDVDGERFDDDLAERKFPSDLFPAVLQTGFNTGDVVARWRSNLGYSAPDAVPADEELPDVRPSPDAGNFLCGFIYYNSLAHYHAMDGEGMPVVFLHVPDLSGSEEKLAVGREVTIALIKALVESRRQLGTVAGQDAKRKKEGAVAGTDVNFA